jgi:c-di-GMP-binding flagellar brake protein YcgR
MAMKSAEPESRRGIFLFESRRFPREYIEIPLIYSIRDNHEDQPLQMEDSLEGGILVYLKDSLDIGTNLNIEIIPPEYCQLKSIKATVQIVWTQLRGDNDEDEHEYGLKFVAVDGNNVSRLKKLLKHVDQ